VKDKGEVGEVISRLEAAGMPTLDISGMEAARVRQARRQCRSTGLRTGLTGMVFTTVAGHPLIESV
jgi:hypothetical protein